MMKYLTIAGMFVAGFLLLLLRESAKRRIDQHFAKKNGTKM